MRGVERVKEVGSCLLVNREGHSPSFYRDNINSHYPQRNPNPNKKANKNNNKRGGAMATFRGQDYFGFCFLMSPKKKRKQKK